MQDINYDLMRVLTQKLRLVNKLERNYIPDAREANCHSVAALEEIVASEKKHIDMLREEISLRCKNDLFN